MKKENSKKTVVLKDKSNEKIKGLGFQLSNNSIFKNIREQAEVLNKSSTFKSINKINETLKPFLKTIDSYKVNIPKIDIQEYKKEEILFTPPRNYEAEKVDLLKEQVALLKKVTKSENNKTIYKDLKIKDIIIKNSKGLLYFDDNHNKNLFYLTDLESKIFKEIQKATKDGGISIENIKKITKQLSIGAVKQTIKQIQIKIKKMKLKDYIKIGSKGGFYYLYIIGNKKGSF